MRFFPSSVYDWENPDEQMVLLLLAHSFVLALFVVCVVFLSWRFLRGSLQGNSAKSTETE
jgi:hypothetical protein